MGFMTRYNSDDSGTIVQMSNLYKFAQLIGVFSDIIALLAIFFIDSRYYPITATLSFFAISFLLFLETVPKESSQLTNPKFKTISYLIGSVFLLPFLWPSFFLFVTAIIYFLDTINMNKKRQQNNLNNV